MGVERGEKKERERGRGNEGWWKETENNTLWGFEGEANLPEFHLIHKWLKLWSAEAEKWVC